MRFVAGTAKRHLLSAALLLLSILFLAAILVINSNGSTAKADTSCGTKPSLSLSTSRIYWGSYSDYTARLLSVDYQVSNGSSEAASSIRVISTNSTNGVSLQTQLPTTFGSIPANGSSSFTLQYTVPAGVSTFRNTIFAQANDSCGNLYGYPSSIALGQTSVTPDTIFVNEPQNSTVKNSIPHDLGSDPFTVDLQQIDENGNFIADEGQLADDGTGTGTYTITKTFSSDTKQIEYYQVVLQTSGQTLASEPFLIRFVNHLTSDELNHISSVQSQGTQTYNQLVQTETPQQAISQVLTQIQSDPNTTQAGLSADGNDIWFEDSSGVLAGLILDSTPDTLSNLSNSTYTASAIQSEPAIFSQSLQSTIDPIGNSKAIVIAPFKSQLQAYDASQNIVDILHNSYCFLSRHKIVPMLKMNR